MIYFISDIHLGLYSRENNLIRENLLLRFLSSISEDCDTLFIVGDLFDFWFEYETVIPKNYYRIISALKEMRLKNIKIEYLMGNHDFGHKSFFEDELDIRIHKSDIEREIDGKKFYISHGDGKNNKDKGYIILKKILRNQFLLKLYTWLHPDIGISLASCSSKTSRNYTGKKNWGENDGMEDFAKTKILHGFDYVIVGHRHKATLKTIGGGTFLDIGDWLNDNPTFGLFDGSNLKLEYVKTFLSENGD